MVLFIGTQPAAVDAGEKPDMAVGFTNPFRFLPAIGSSPNCLPTMTLSAMRIVTTPAAVISRCIVFCIVELEETARKFPPLSAENQIAVSPHRHLVHFLRDCLDGFLRVNVRDAVAMVSDT